MLSDRGGEPPLWLPEPSQWWHHDQCITINSCKLSYIRAPQPSKWIWGGMGTHLRRCCCSGVKFPSKSTILTPPKHEGSALFRKNARGSEGLLNDRSIQRCHSSSAKHRQSGAPHRLKGCGRDSIAMAPKSSKSRMAISTNMATPRAMRAIPWLATPPGPSQRRVSDDSTKAVGTLY